MMETMRADFEEAFKQHDEDETVDETVTENIADEVQETDETSEPSETQAETEKTDETPADQDTDPDDEQAQPDNPEDSAGIEKAPVSWTPLAREHWKDLPVDVQKQVAKREQQIAKALENGKEQRKTGERFMDVVNKYQPIIAAEGIQDPIEGFKGLMNSIAGLRMGTPQQKANIVAQMVNVYGVDVTALDNILSANITGKPVQNTEEQRLNAMLEQRLAPVNDFMQDLDQQRRQMYAKQEQKVYSEVEQFGATHEYYEDVRHTMADLIDTAAANGRDLSLEQAYSAACAADPEISKVLQNRNYQATIAQKKQAASSISGKQGGNPVGNNDSIRSALMNAIEG